MEAGLQSPAPNQSFNGKRRVLVRRRKTEDSQPKSPTTKYIVARKVHSGQELSIPNQTISIPTINSRGVITVPESLVKRDTLPHQITVDNGKVYEWCVLGQPSDFESPRLKSVREENRSDSVLADDQTSTLERARREEARRFNRTMRSLQPGDRIAATREGRVMQRWSDMNKTWGELI
jgi:hypothetical protein